LVDRALEVSSDDYNVYIPFINALKRLGQNERVQELRESQTRSLEQQLESVPEDVRARILLAVYYANFGKEDEAIRLLQTAVTLRPNDPNTLYNAACTYGVLQKKAEALDMLKKARDAGYSSFNWAARDPDLACLHGDPEFQHLMKGGEHKG